MLELRIPRRLESPNTWNGRHWRFKHRLSQVWEQELWVAGAQQIEARAYFNQKERVRVEVERHVPNFRHFMRDDDNLRFAVKPLLDALKRLSYIRNDSRKWLDHPTPTQRVSSDGKDWTIVRIGVRGTDPDGRPQ